MTINFYTTPIFNNPKIAYGFFTRKEGFSFKYCCIIVCNNVLFAGCPYLILVLVNDACTLGSGSLTGITVSGGTPGYTFDWNDKAPEWTREEEGQYSIAGKGKDIGVIAQEIEKVLPETVHRREDGYLSVKYDKIVPLLIEGIKEQQTQIEDLKNRINKLESKK